MPSISGLSFSINNMHLVEVFPVISSKKNFFIADTKAGNALRLCHAQWMISSVPLIVGLVYHKQQERKVSLSLLSGEVPDKHNWEIPVTCITAPAKQWSCRPEESGHPNENQSHRHAAVADAVTCNGILGSENSTWKGKHISETQMHSYTTS